MSDTHSVFHEIHELFNSFSKNERYIKGDDVKPFFEKVKMYTKEHNLLPVSWDQLSFEKFLDELDVNSHGNKISLNDMYEWFYTVHQHNLEDFLEHANNIIKEHKEELQNLSLFNTWLNKISTSQDSLSELEKKLNSKSAELADVFNQFKNHGTIQKADIPNFIEKVVSKMQENASVITNHLDLNTLLVEADASQDGFLSYTKFFAWYKSKVLEFLVDQKKKKFEFALSVYKELTKLIKDKQTVKSFDPFLVDLNSPRRVNHHHQQQQQLEEFKSTFLVAELVKLAEEKVEQQKLAEAALHNFKKSEDHHQQQNQFNNSDFSVQTKKLDEEPKDEPILSFPQQSKNKLPPLEVASSPPPPIIQTSLLYEPSSSLGQESTLFNSSSFNSVNSSLNSPPSPINSSSLVHCYNKRKFMENRFTLHNSIIGVVSIPFLQACTDSYTLEHSNIDKLYEIRDLILDTRASKEEFLALHSIEAFIHYFETHYNCNNNSNNSSNSNSSSDYSYGSENSYKKNYKKEELNLINVLSRFFKIKLQAIQREKSISVHEYNAKVKKILIKYHKMFNNNENDIIKHGYPATVHWRTIVFEPPIEINNLCLLLVNKLKKILEENSVKSKVETLLSEIQSVIQLVVVNNDTCFEKVKREVMEMTLEGNRFQSREDEKNWIFGIVINSILESANAELTEVELFKNNDAEMVLQRLKHEKKRCIVM